MQQALSTCHKCVQRYHRVCRRVAEDTALPADQRKAFHLAAAKSDMARVSAALSTNNAGFCAFELLLDQELLINVAAVRPVADVLGRLATHPGVAPGVFWLLLHPHASLRALARTVVERYQRDGLPLDAACDPARAVVQCLCGEPVLGPAHSLAALGLVALAAAELWPALAFLFKVMPQAVFESFVEHCVQNNAVMLSQVSSQRRQRGASRRAGVVPGCAGAASLAFFFYWCSWTAWTGSSSKCLRAGGSCWPSWASGCGRRVWSMSRGARQHCPMQRQGRGARCGGADVQREGPGDAVGRVGVGQGAAPHVCLSRQTDSADRRRLPGVDGAGVQLAAARAAIGARHISAGPNAVPDL